MNFITSCAQPIGERVDTFYRVPDQRVGQHSPSVKVKDVLVHGDYHNIVVVDLFFFYGEK